MILIFLLIVGCSVQYKTLETKDFKIINMSLQENQEKNMHTLTFFIQNNETINDCDFLVEILQEDVKINESSINLILQPEEVKQSEIVFEMPEGLSDVVLVPKCK
jgi:hypothetical protein